MNKFLLIIIVFIFTLITCNTAAAVDTNHTYTNDSDFDNGTLVGVEHNTTHNQLQLSNNTTNNSGIVQPFIWVPNSNQSTVSKVDTITGKEIARYRTCPEKMSAYANPSRTTVDLYGNCWVGNRQTGTAVKIGLYENGQYIDRNHNGKIETSRDLNGDGVISGDELLPWGQDECVLYEVILIPGSEGTYAPGDYKGAYVNDYHNPGPRGLAVDSKNNVWIGTYGTMKYYYVSGATGQILKCIDISSAGHTPYGAVIDQNGILWSSGENGNNVLRLDPSNDSFIRINLDHTAYGLALDNNNHLFVTGLGYCKLSRINVLTGEIEWTKSSSYGQGAAVTPDGDVWTANNYQNTVTRFSNDGDFKATISVGKTPTGVAVDKEGKVWVVDFSDEYIYRIDPATNAIDITKQIPGGLHYGYSDMTGLISNTITTRRGTWTVTHDSGLQNTPWGIISWKSSEPQGTSIKVRARSSNDNQNWSNWEDTNNGSQLSSTPPGRYLQVETTFQINSGNISPILYDLTVRAPLVDIAITSQSNNTKPHPGDIVQFIIKAKNNGPTDATGVKVNYHLPSGFEFISSSPAYNPSTHIWNIGNLTNGASTSLLIQARSTTTGRFISSAWASSQEYDLNITNNFALLSVTALAQPLAPYQPPNQVPIFPNGNPGTITTPVNPNSGILKVIGAHKEISKIQSKNSNKTLPLQETGLPLNPSGLAILLIMFGNLAHRKNIANNKYFWILIGLCFIFMACGTVSAANTTICVSNSTNGSGSNSDSSEAHISSNGNYITFTSYADNLVSNDSNGYSDIFVYDINSGKTTRVSVSSGGSEADSNSYQPSISADGRYIAFTSYAHNLVEGDNSYYSNVFVHDMNSGKTVRISVSSTGEEVDGNSFAPSISADGRYVAFVSYAHNLVNGGSTSEYYGTNIYIHDMISGTTENITALDTDELYKYYGQPSISSDGRYIAFTSDMGSPRPSLASKISILANSDNNLQSFEDIPNYSKILVYDRITGITENISISSTGEAANGDCAEPSISADGRYVTFSSYADNLVSGDTNQMTDIFVHDRLLGTTSRVSISNTGEEADYDSYSPSISPDGSHIAFASWATNLVAGDTNSCADIFVRDLISGTTKRISVSYSGEEANDDSYGYSGGDYASNSYTPSLNNNGSLTVFSSHATNLIPFDNNGYPDIFLYGPNTNFYTIYGQVSPDILRSGNSTSIHVYADPSTESIVASILGNNYNLQKQADGTWNLNYIIPTVADGLYDVLLTAENNEGKQTTYTLHFTVDNTPPTIVGSVNPDSLNMYTHTITITASSDNDTQSMTATILGETFDMYRTGDNIWTLQYTVPNLPDGIYPITLTAKDTAGNQGTESLNFTLDNTPPTVTGTINPNIVKAGDSFIITAISDPDTERIEVGIPGVGLGYFTKQADGTWIYKNYTVTSWYSDGNYTVNLWAYDRAGNCGSASLEYTVDNPPHISVSYSHVVRPGVLTSITVYSDPDVANATVSVFNKTFNMVKQGGNDFESVWSVNCTVPTISDGEYPIIFTATDKRGNQATLSKSLWVDCTPPTITGTLNPHVVKVGDTITISAYSDLDTESITATILGEKFSMNRQVDGTWQLSYAALNVIPGEIYYIVLNAVDRVGNHGNASLKFEVFAPPTIEPNTVKSGDKFTVTAHDFLELENTESMTARILGETFNMTKQAGGKWTLSYTVPDIPNGPYSVALNAKDSTGNQGNTIFVTFTVNNAPRIIANINPNLVKSGNTFKITANSDQDTQSIIVRIFGETLTMDKETGDTWGLYYTVPQVYDGNYFAILTAISSSGRGTAQVNFTVDNTPPMMNVELTPGDVLPGGQLNFTAFSDDAENVSADFETQENNLSYANGLWNGNYIVPSITALGSYPAIFSASDKAGNVGSVSVLYNVVASISPTINPGGTGGSTGSGSQSGSIGNGGTSTGSSGSTSGTSGTTGSSGSNSGTSTGGSSGSNSGGTGGSSGSGTSGDSSGGSGGSEGSDTGGSFWDNILNFLNELWNLFLKILPFLLLAIGIIMVLGFFFPAVAAIIFALCYIIGSLILDLLVPFLSALIFDISSIPAIAFTSIGYLTTALSPEFFGFSSIILLMGSIIFGVVLGFSTLAGVFAILAFAFALIALYIFIADLLKGVDIFAFWKKLLS